MEKKNIKENMCAGILVEKNLKQRKMQIGEVVQTEFFFCTGEKK